MTPFELAAHVGADVDLVDDEGSEEKEDFDVVHPRVGDLDVLHHHAVQTRTAQVDPSEARAPEILVGVLGHGARVYASIGSAASVELVPDAAR
jgi:hypothetical protein